MVADAQSAFEKMMTALAHAQSGVNFIWGAGNLESTIAMSPEALVMDDEIAGYSLRFQKGFQVTDQEMALDLIREVGLGGDFLSNEHTLRNHRRVLTQARLAVRERRATWEAHGGHSYEEAASARVQQILSRPTVPLLDERQEAELLRIERAGVAELAP
jgi:trimethylamine--corrinoid protein Co-methyltransferase